MSSGGQLRGTRWIPAALAGLLLLSGCELPDEADRAPSDSRKVASERLPSLVGKGLQSAQDAAQAAGFFSLTSHDALGRGREQIFDRNWKVCGQKPAAGRHKVSVKVDFSVVKLQEKCPKADKSGDPLKTGGALPDFRGRSVKAARRALPSSTSFEARDADKRGRAIIIESNWKVCTQSPSAGAKYDGEPVLLTAVKYGERCP